MIRIPEQQLATFTAGTTSSSSVVVLPIGDFEALVAYVSGPLTGTQNIYISTFNTLDGNYYDVVSFTQITSTVAATNPYFAYIPTASGQAKYAGQAAYQTLSAGTISGIPLLSKQVKISNVAAGSASTLTVTLVGIGQSGGY